MKRISILRDLYLETFRQIGNILIKYYFKAFFWFCFSIFIIVLYAFLYRVMTGFPFG